MPQLTQSSSEEFSVLTNYTPTYAVRWQSMFSEHFGVLCAGSSDNFDLQSVRDAFYSHLPGNCAMSQPRKVVMTS